MRVVRCEFRGSGYELRGAGFVLLGAGYGMWGWLRKEQDLR